MTRIILITVFGMILSCNNNQGTNKTSKTENKNYPNFNKERLLGSFERWYNYHYDSVILTNDFIALNNDSIKITKSQFFDSLVTGKYIAGKTSPDTYKLYTINRQADKRISEIIQQLSQSELEHFNREGTDMPSYNFVDVMGYKYDNNSMKGKLVLLKCWFINCTACVKEFPQLNDLVEKYKSRNDVVFLSLATDPKKELIDFLKKKPFEYAVVPEAEAYISEKLKVTAYPTHFLIGRSGKILKVSNSIENLIPFLEKSL